MHPTTFAYDPNGNLFTETYPNSTTTSFLYNAADQLQRVTAARTGGSPPFRRVFRYGRDPIGQVSSTTDRLEGMRHSYAYDALNRLTGDSGSNRTSTSWSYDSGDNLTGISDTATSTSQTLNYDAAHELTTLRREKPGADAPTVPSARTFLPSDRASLPVQSGHGLMTTGQGVP